MTTLKKKSWLEFYKSLTNYNLVNSQMDQLSGLFSHQVNDADLIQNLKEDPGSFLLAVDHFNIILLLHQASILGPSLFQPEQFILALSGAGASAMCFCIHPSTFSTPVKETPCLSWGHLKGASSNTEVQALVAPVDTSNKVKSRCAIVVPPMVALVLLANTTQLAEDLIPLLIDAFKTYDQTSENAKVCTSLHHVIFFLWVHFRRRCLPLPWLLTHQQRAHLGWQCYICHVSFKSPITLLMTPSYTPQAYQSWTTKQGPSQTSAKY